MKTAKMSMLNISLNSSCTNFPYLYYGSFGKGLFPLKRLLSLTIKLMVLFILCVGGLAVYLSTQALPVSKVEQNTILFDINGATIDSGGNGQNRQIVSLTDISPHLVQATLAIEDQRFYSHFGFDIKSVARAALVNIKHMDKVQGAGTITQQLARNLYLTHERTWSRKLKELMYAVQLEFKFSKDEILEKYLNQIYFGHSTYGIEAAAQLFFGKHAKDLTLAQSALLAGIPNGPRYFSPYYDETKSLERQKLVLNAMEDSGFITKEEADAAKQESLVFKPLESRKASTASYFRDFVHAQAIEKLGMTEDEFDQSGVRVYTTLDLQAQRMAEEIVTRKLTGTDELQAALIAIDPRSGFIKAMVGGKDYKTSQFNRAVSGMRQPGSAFKPMVYLTALENGFTALTQFRSEPTVFTYDEGRQTYMPSNFNDQYENDWIDMRRAIAKSDNIYAVHTILQLGADKVIETAKHVGIQSPLKPLPSLALGTFPMSPLELAAAYSTIANQGERIEPIAILRIEDAAGRILYEAKPKSEQAASPAATYVLTHLMESVFEDGGTGARVAAMINRPIAGKSGSTDSDSWMVGYTPELAAAVWVGYDKGRTISLAESHISAPIFAEFIEGVLSAVPPKPFSQPDDAITLSIDPVSGKLANENCSDSARLESFIIGTEPKAYCSEDGSKVVDPPANDLLKRSWWDKVKRWWMQ